MDRLPEMWEAAKEEAVGLIAAHTQSFLLSLDESSATIDEFLSHISELFHMLARQQAEGRKAPLRYLTLSFLKSGVVAETYALACTCHSVNLYLDDAETETYWRMDFIRDMVNGDMERLVPRLRETFFRMKDAEIEAFRVHYALNYTPLLLAFFERALPRALALPAFHAVTPEERVDVTFGGYMEEQTTIFVRYTP